MSRELYYQAEADFDRASQIAASNSLSLDAPSDGCYQLRSQSPKWIINYYPRGSGLKPRIFHDEHHRGPFLRLPDMPTLTDFVEAAVKANTTAAKVDE